MTKRMNKTEIINQIAAVTGESVETCEIVLKAFEKVSEEALTSKFHGNSFSSEEKIAMVSELAQVDIETSRKLVTELNNMLEVGLSNKLRIFGRNSEIK